MMRELFAHGLGGVAFRDDLPLEMAARGLGMIRTAPGWFLGRVRRWADGRLRRELNLSLARLAFGVLRGEIQAGSLTLTSHHFMSPEELRTPIGQDRLAACLFRVPYKGEMVPMCKMNADGVRERFYTEILEGAR